MLFNSLIFIFWFLPICFVINQLCSKKLSNYWLAFASLFFYFWGESQYAYIFAVSVLVNFVLGLVINRLNSSELILKGGPKTFNLKIFFGLSIVFNLLLLGNYKYLNFLIDSINHTGIISTIPNPPIHLPIGISFFTFEAIAYLTDLYNKKSKVIKNPVDLLLYMGIFPHLIAGPVIRYQDLESQLKDRHVQFEDILEGLKRFILGLGKKVIIANGIGQIADKVFDPNFSGSGANLYWIGLVAYGLQLFFDFSGYSDMAIGLGRLFGFRFIENFNYPYVSTSVQEFWRRWNISLGLWFKEYVYIPLGGSRVSFGRNLLNLLIVFFLTGLWHGAGLNFIAWGLMLGILIILEKLFLVNLFSKLGSVFGKIVSHFYLIFVILLSWVFFRSSDFGSALVFISKLFRFEFQSTSQLFNKESLLIFVLGILLSFPWLRTLVQHCTSKTQDTALEGVLNLLFNTFYLALFLISLGYIITSTYNPFIYFRF